MQLSRKTWSQQQQLRLVCLNSELRRLQREDGQLLIVLSALTDGECFDVVMISRRGPWLRELAQAARKVEPVHSGASAKSLEGDSVADASKIA